MKRCLLEERTLRSTLGWHQTFSVGIKKRYFVGLEKIVVRNTFW